MSLAYSAVLAGYSLLGMQLLVAASTVSMKVT